ncbi:MAG: ComEC family competence protein [Lentimicrobiaceae bacterium]|nr:ComEC family competence protein [Lentimicrobiaceae bacterium]
MNPVHQFPFVRLLVPFLLGILSSLAFSISTVPLFVLPLIFFLLLFILLNNKTVHYRNRWWFGMLLFFFLFLSGNRIVFQQSLQNSPESISNNYKKGDFLLLKISEPVQQKAKTNRTVACIISLFKNGKHKKVNVKVMLYFADSTSKSLRYGDIIICNSPLQLISPPKNPNEFDYQKYLARKGIYYQAYIKPYQWLPLQANQGNFFREQASKVRAYFLLIFEKHGVSGKEYAVASALILGNTDKLDAELMAEYAGSGAMHILSVSGLHVGIVYMVLDFLLFFMNRNRTLRILKAIFIFLFIWFYAFITGLAPAILRAAVMISFIIAGNVYSQKPNIINSIAASAFIVLLYNPFLVTDVGFQLSYLAVTGIVLLQKPIYSLWIPANYLLEKAWALCSVSIAAQLVTFPLSLYYFHQFPNYFLITNLIAVPLSGFIIYTGALTLLVSPLHVLCDAVSFFMVLLLKILNFTVHFIENLPGAILQNLYLNTLQLFLIYLLLTFVILFCFQWKKTLLISSLLFLLLFSISVFYNRLNAENQKLIVVYNIKKHTAIDFISGTKSWQVMDSTLLKEDKILKYSIYPNRIRMHLKKQSNFFLRKDNKYILWEFSGKKIVVVKKPLDHNICDTARINYLVIAGNPKVNIRELLQFVHVNIIVFDASNSVGRVRKWVEECKLLNVKYYSVFEKGAFVANLQ